MSRNTVVLAAICIAAGLAAPPSHASCGAPTPMTNFNGFPIINCPDGMPATAYAYQPGAVFPTNTGLLDIICEVDTGTFPCFTMSGNNAVGDGIVAISTDWSVPGISGCPTGRVYVSLQCNEGSGALLSISGGCSVLGYSIEAAYNSNEDGSRTNLDVNPLTTPQKNGRPIILTFTRSGGMDLFDVQVDPPFLQSDCSAGSYGQLLFNLGYCLDTELNCAGLAQPSRGNLYSFTGPCTSSDQRPVNRDRVQWVARPLDAAGHALVGLPTPPAGRCNYLGTSTVVAGAESAFITGYVLSESPFSASPMLESVSATRNGNSVEVAFATSTEGGLAGFNIYAVGKAKGSEIKLNSSLIAPKGVAGSGASYSVFFVTADFKGSRSVVVELVLTDGTTLRAAPVDF